MYGHVIITTCCNHFLAVDMSVACRGILVCAWLAKNGKKCATAIHKSIVLFLPCLVTFWEIPSLHGSSFLLNVFFINSVV